MPLTAALLRREWQHFRRPGRLIALLCAALIVIALGVLYSAGSRSSCPGGCPITPTGPDGTAVNDQFAFVHRELGPTGSITVRLTELTGTITYPPPNHDQIVSGVVPWAKAGIMIKDGLRQGSRYAAIMMTGSHGVRMQDDYLHDSAGSAGEAGDVSAERPRWLRLTRSGDSITGQESVDGRQWTTVGTVTLGGLPETVRVGLFATSPGDLTLRPVGLGGSLDESRFTQATARFDQLGVDGTGADSWHAETVGEMNHTDWEKYRQPSGAVIADGIVTISGTGDIGPATSGVFWTKQVLVGLPVALIIILIVAVGFGVGAPRDRTDPITPPELIARAVIIGASTFALGLVTVSVVLLTGPPILHLGGTVVVPLAPSVAARVIIGLPLVLSLTAVLALTLGALLRRRWPAITLALATIALPYLLTVVPLLPDPLVQWLLRLTPAAGFAVQQTVVEYPQVTAHYAPTAGYFPLPGWAGVAVLCGYLVLILIVAATPSRPPHGPISD